MSGPSDLLKLPQVVAECGVGRNTVYRWLTAGVGGVRLAAYRMGGTWRVARSDLDAFIAETTRRSLPAGAPSPADRDETPASRRRRDRAARELAARLGI